MKLLWFSALLPLVLAQAEFGTSYLKNSRLCSQWSCLNEQLGLSDALPTKEEVTRIFQSLLPEGPWQDAVNPALDVCYGDRPRRYTNTCPGQALMHCVVEQLIANCPAENWRKEDACAPVTCLAGFKYMFSQSRYNDLEKNLPTERRPAWFLKNYFNQKCCDLPPIFNETVLSRCGFSSIMHYYKQHTRTYAPTNTLKVENKTSEKGDVVRIVSFDDVKTTTPKVTVEVYGEYDPLDCCDINEFISPTWRSDCGFEMSWSLETRLTIKNSTTAVAGTPTSAETPQTLKTKDVKMVPYPCEKSNCVFRSLNIVSESGAVDVDAFSKLLNNLTFAYPDWVKAKGRVLTKCLSRPIRDYEYDCDINKVLACTFDVLSENCPNAKTPDECRHHGGIKNEAICQISSSKYRPKNRRLFCGIPNLVNHEVLSQCDLNSLIDLEYVPEPVIKAKPNSGVTKVRFSKECQDSTPSTVCLMEKMGVLNKYSFMDYFRMRVRVRTFSHDEWFPFINTYNAVLQGVPMYQQHCSSPKKLLNVIDAMLMTCPFSKRRDTLQCKKMFSDLTNEMPKHGQNEQLLKHFGHVFHPAANHLDIGLPQKYHTIKNPIYNFGLLNTDLAPPVRILDLRAHRSQGLPLVLLPVYQRYPFSQYKDSMLRSAPIKPNSV